jgi:hypothetical protein
MSTYSAFHRANDPRPSARQKAWGLLSGSYTRVLWAASYGPTNLDTTGFPPLANDWGTKYPLPDIAPPLLAEGEGPPS